MWRFAIQRIPVETCIEMTIFYCVYLENAKSSLCAEGPHHYNIFFRECTLYTLAFDPRSSYLMNHFGELDFVPQKYNNLQHIWLAKAKKMTPKFTMTNH